MARRFPLSVSAPHRCRAPRPQRRCAPRLRRVIRLIDTAENYHNEDAVGRGIRESGIDRAELFVTSKFNRHWHSVREGTRPRGKSRSTRVGLLDLLLVHWPNPDQDHYCRCGSGLGELLDSGASAAIGTSNFKPAHLQRVLDETGIVPDVNQIQLNPIRRARPAALPRLNTRS